MTALLDPRPGSGDPVPEGLVEGLAEVHQLLDRMQLGVRGRLGTGDHARLVCELDRAGRRIAALKLKVVAAAERAGAPSDAGFTGTEAWVARHTTVSRAHAAGEVALATGLETGHEATAAALDAGLVSPAHAAVILNAAHQLPATISPAQRVQVEARLVEQATRHDPDQLRRIARRALEAVEPDPGVVDAHENDLVRGEEQTARDRCALSLHENGDGTTTGHFTIPALAAAILGTVIDAITAPRRMRRTSGIATLAGPRTSTEFDWRHRRGLAFAELLEHLPTEHLHPKTAATVVITLEHTVLHGALKAAHLDTGETLSAGEARRLACGAGLVPAVLGTASVALDLGRESRLFSEAQRLATGLRHTTCAAQGCQRPYAWCELHHKKPWAHGGRTDLADAIPLCHRHHQMIHDPGFDHRHLPDGTIRVSTRT